MVIFFFKQKTAYEMRISDWSSDVCSSDLFGERKATQLGAAKAEIGKAEQDAVLVHFGGEPGRLSDGVEETDHRDRVGLAHSLGERDVPSGVVGAQGVADFGRDEDHAAVLPSTAARSLLPRWSSLAATAASGRKASR